MQHQYIQVMIIHNCLLKLEYIEKNTFNYGKKKKTNPGKL